VKTEWIEITDPKDWQVGDTFEGLFIEEPLYGGYRIEHRASGKLQRSAHLSPALYVASRLPYVTDPQRGSHWAPWENKWTDVRVTREVEIPPTLEETLEALPQGSVVYLDNLKKSPLGRGTWVYNKDEGWWVSSKGVEKDSAELAYLIEHHGDNRWSNEFVYKIVNRNEVEI
jgi:hypothetical protein